MRSNCKQTAYTVVDDYGHHPTEIRATLETARSLESKRVVVMFQPHRYTRTEALKKEFGTAFDRADLVYVTDIYAASEKPIPGVSGHTIVIGFAGSRTSGRRLCAQTKHFAP